MIDTTFVEIPRQRNAREENKQINADEANKLVQSYAVTDAAVHDSRVF